MSEIWKFCRKFRKLCPPPPEIVNFRHWAYFLEESSISMNSLAPETSHIMALKIKDYIISSLLLSHQSHHYLRLIVHDHSYSAPGLSGWVAHGRRVRLSRRLGILWLIVADRECIYWLYFIYGPDLLYPYLLLYYTLHPTTISYPEQCLCAGYEGIGSGEIEFFLCCDWFNVYQ
jgi:hypothetical protein